MRKRSGIALKWTAVFLSVLLFVSVIPMRVFAADSVPAPVSEAAGETSADEAKILAEDTRKRTQNGKHFYKSDGTMQAVQYAVPVHFFDGEKWADYDNTLVEVDAAEEENIGSLFKNKDLTNHTADFSVRLSKKTNGKKFVRLEKDGYMLSWFYLDAEKCTASVKKTAADDDPASLERLMSEVTYKNVYKDVDFTYIIGSNGIKENIILNCVSSQNYFEAEYKTNGLTPIQQDSRTILLQNADGETVYTLSAPYMCDAVGASSDAVTLALIKVESNRFTVRLDSG